MIGGSSRHISEPMILTDESNLKDNFLIDNDLEALQEQLRLINEKLHNECGHTDDANLNSAGVNVEPLHLNFEDKQNEINTEELSYGSQANEDFTVSLQNVSQPKEQEVSENTNSDENDSDEEEGTCSQKSSSGDQNKYNSSSHEQEDLEMQSGNNTLSEIEEDQD